MFNEAGQVARDFSHVYYCGQKLLKARTVELMRSSGDGWCGPKNGPQCRNCTGMFSANILSLQTMMGVYCFLSCPECCILITEII